MNKLKRIFKIIFEKKCDHLTLLQFFDASKTRMVVWCNDCMFVRDYYRFQEGTGVCTSDKKLNNE